ncbi:MULTISPECIES: MarR family winged helix-turn-helix transcriptional regulator [Sphingobacterium]|uniref:MarR family winged helix-turn-helix transcriptional regulator n=1 Tax=Sphingobacterium TaxID=28453 RepID=UPI00104F652F|nr:MULTISPECIES: helix-turn-helix domain-containing protein [Sphingobacterium]MCW2259522.1 DNA-binding MarR family transcriptional regulator [Sphingobacterium kitahiroshimense]TCR14032.1 DNA-binding MarR family transcriptional regulator [Sphingobacterium sp. JUb78]
MDIHSVLDPVGYIRTVYALKKDIEEWAEANLQDLWPGKFQLSYMQVLIHIDKDGTTNKLLAQQAQISKQAMSRIISHMVEKNVITIQPMSSDKRYSKIMLTDFGNQIVSESLVRVSQYFETISKDVDRTSIINSLSVLNSLIRK